MDSKYKQQHKKVYSNTSHINGIGIFAKKNIQKGENVGLIRGKVINWIVKNKETSKEGPNWIGFGKNKWINSLYPFNRINHSCSPNLGIRGSRTMVALKNIKKGEELLLDYSITESDQLWKLDKKCKCGSKNCRKIIKSIQYIPKEVFNGYMPHIPKYFQKVYKKHHNKNAK